MTTDPYPNMTTDQLVKAHLLLGRVVRWLSALTLAFLVGGIWVDYRWALMALLSAIITVVFGFASMSAFNTVQQRDPGRKFGP